MRVKVLCRHDTAAFLVYPETLDEYGKALRALPG